MVFGSPACLEVFEIVAYMRLSVYILQNVLRPYECLEQICEQAWLIKESLGY